MLRPHIRCHGHRVFVTLAPDAHGVNGLQGKPVGGQAGPITPQVFLPEQFPKQVVDLLRRQGNSDYIDPDCLTDHARSQQAQAA